MLLGTRFCRYWEVEGGKRERGVTQEQALRKATVHELYHKEGLLKTIFLFDEQNNAD